MQFLQINNRFALNVLHADPGFLHSGTGSGSESKRLFRHQIDTRTFFLNYEPTEVKCSLKAPLPFLDLDLQWTRGVRRHKESRGSSLTKLCPELLDLLRGLDNDLSLQVDVRLQRSLLVLQCCQSGLCLTTKYTTRRLTISRYQQLTQDKSIVSNFMFWSAGCSLLRAEGFFYNLDVL